MKIKRKTHIKDIDKGRFFFTADEELRKWIKNSARELGVKPPVFITMNMYKSMKEANANT